MGFLGGEGWPEETRAGGQGRARRGCRGDHREDGEDRGEGVGGVPGLVRKADLSRLPDREEEGRLAIQAFDLAESFERIANREGQDFPESSPA